MDLWFLCGAGLVGFLNKWYLWNLFGSLHAAVDGWMITVLFSWGCAYDNQPGWFVKYIPIVCITQFNLQDFIILSMLSFFQWLLHQFSVIAMLKEDKAVNIFSLLYAQHWNNQLRQHCANIKPVFMDLPHSVL